MSVKGLDQAQLDGCKGRKGFNVSTANTATKLGPCYEAGEKMEAVVYGV